MKFNREPDKHGDVFSEDVANQLNKAIADFAQRASEMQFNQRIIMHPVDTGRLRESMSADGKLYQRLSGMPIIESSFVEQGKAYLVPGASPIPKDFDMMKFERAINEVLASSFGIPPRYFQNTPPNYNRYGKESILDYGKRLAKLGVLDNPEIRWLYQKEVLTFAFVLPVQKLIELIRDRI